MARIKSAAELDVAPSQQANTLQGIRTTALEQVRQFCERQGLEPGQFMSAMGWLNERDWRRGVDWQQCVNWNQFNDVIFSNITPNRRGLDVRGFNQELAASRETFEQNAAPRPRERRAEQRAAEQPAPRQEEQQAPQPQRVKSPMSAQTWANAYSQTEDILDRYPRLSEEQRTAVHNIVDLSAPENRSLVEMNLRSYMDHLVRNERVMSRQEADRMFSEVMVVVQGAEQSVLAERRGPTVKQAPPEQRLARAGLTPRGQEEAPARQETYVYRFSVIDARGVNRDHPRTLSTFEVTSPERIQDADHLSNFLGSLPAGATVTRVRSDGSRIRVDDNEQEMARLRSGVQTILGTPGLRIELAEQEGRRGGTT